MEPMASLRHHLCSILGIETDCAHQVLSPQPQRVHLRTYLDNPKEPHTYTPGRLPSYGGFATCRLVQTSEYNPTSAHPGARPRRRSLAPRVSFHACSGRFPLANARSHVRQLIPLSLLCKAMWDFRSKFFLNTLEHASHAHSLIRGRLTFGAALCL